ncbi:MAG: Hsp20/alpha crystallin family protein [Candidatus Thermoplasmatota archaeon]|nr:Hsp20/alpha crystallin family protein [Candidatus Thermoplasmatota archaeon]
MTARKDEDEDRDDEDRRGRRDPFGNLFGFSDMFGFKDIDKEFKEMRKMAEEMFEQGREKRGKDPFVYGFSIRQGPKGEPKIEEFGNAKDYFHKSDESDEKSEWTPLTDVQETGEEVLVTVDVPGVEKRNIDLNVKDDILIVSVDGKRRYRKKVNLPAKVDSGEAEASYNNGVLEVKLKKITEEMGESIEIE